MNIKLIAIVGSLRAASVNRIVAEAAVQLAAEGTDMALFDVSDIPLYNGDVEEAGLPTSVQALHDGVAAADGLLFFSPEYNGSFPAVTKNAIDWMSRPPASWEGTAVSMVTTTPGPRAGASIRAHFDAIMPFQPVRLFRSLGFGTYNDKIADGQLTDQATRDELAAYIGEFATFSASSQ